MSTSNNNAVLYGLVNGQGFIQYQVAVDDTSHRVHQGDLVYLDSSSHKAYPIASDANAATLLGVALEPSYVNSNLDNGLLVNNPVLSIAIGAGVLCNYQTTAGETYTTGTKVYYQTDAQHVTTTAGSNPVGVVMLPQTQSSVTGAAGTLVPIIVYSHSLISVAT